MTAAVLHPQQDHAGKPSYMLHKALLILDSVLSLRRASSCTSIHSLGVPAGKVQST